MAISLKHDASNHSMLSMRRAALKIPSPNMGEVREGEASSSLATTKTQIRSASQIASLDPALIAPVSSG